MVIDTHSHILPGMDDGSASVAESIKMLRLQAQQGITHVVATPHFYPQHDSPEQFLIRRSQAEAALREEMAKHDGLPRLAVGAEVYFYSGISDSDKLRGLTIGENACILIEMPMPPWTEQMYAELAGIYEKQGLIPIIAHVDRYISPLHSNGIPERLGQLPVLVQANAESFLRFSTRRMMLRLLKNGQIHLLGSDCHDTQKRPPNLRAAADLVRHQLGPEAIEHIHYYEQKMLQGS